MSEAPQTQPPTGGTAQPPEPAKPAKEKWSGQITIADRGVLPRNVEEMEKVAIVFSKSGLVPAAFANNPAAVFTALQLGFELGMRPMQALRSIMVIDGRPTVFGDAMLALCKQSGVFDHQRYKVEWTGKGETRVCAVTVARLGCPPFTATFSLADAKQAGLLGKKGSMYQFWPDRMLRARALAFALREVFTEILMGMYAAEELQDSPKYIDNTAGTPTETAEPNPAQLPQTQTGRLADTLIGAIPAQSVPAPTQTPVTEETAPLAEGTATNGPM